MLQKGNVFTHGGEAVLSGYADVLPALFDQFISSEIQSIVIADVFSVLAVTAARTNIAINILIVAIGEGPKRKPFTYHDNEYADRYIRHCSSYHEYAKDICANYRLDQKRRKLINERRQYIGVSGKADYSAMCEDISFLHQSLKTVLSDHIEIFQTRFAKGLSVRKAAEELQVNRGVIERRQAALIDAFSRLLHERDQADGICRLYQKPEVTEAE